MSRQNGNKKGTRVHKDKSNCESPVEPPITNFFVIRYCSCEKRGKSGFIGKKEVKEAEWDARINRKNRRKKSRKIARIGDKSRLIANFFRFS